MNGTDNKRSPVKLLVGFFLEYLIGLVTFTFMFVNIMMVMHPLAYRGFQDSFLGITIFACTLFSVLGYFVARFMIVPEIKAARAMRQRALLGGSILLVTIVFLSLDALVAPVLLGTTLAWQHIMRIPGFPVVVIVIIVSISLVEILDDLGVVDLIGFAWKRIKGRHEVEKVKEPST